MYIITIKLPKNPEHDPRNKKMSVCEFSPVCTDATGEHHSFLGTDETLALLRGRDTHITRVELVAYENVMRVVRSASRTDEEVKIDQEVAAFIREKFRNAGWPVVVEEK